MGPVKFPLGPVESTVDLSMEDHLQKLVSSTGCLRDIVLLGFYIYKCDKLSRVNITTNK